MQRSFEHPWIGIFYRRRGQGEPPVYNCNPEKLLAHRIYPSDCSQQNVQHDSIYLQKASWCWQ